MLLFTDGSDLKGVHRPLDIKYMKYLRNALLALGGWPGKLFGEKERYRFKHQCVNTLVSFSCLTFGILFIRNNMRKLSFFEMGQSYITVLMNVLCVSRYSSFFWKKYDIVVRDFVYDIHLFNFRNKSEYAYKTHIFIHKLSHFFTGYATVLAASSALFFNVLPMYNNIAQGGFSLSPPANITYEHSVYYELPFDYQHNFRGFIVLFIFNLYISTMCGIIIAFYDFLLALFIFHLYGHLKILIHNLENFPRPGYKEDRENIATNTHFSDEELLDVFKRLKDIIKHHKLILRYTDDMSKACGLNVAIYYAFHQISGCLLLLECSEGGLKGLFRFGPLTASLLQLLMQISVTFELLCAMNVPLMRAAYEMPWECMDTKNRKLALMLLKQTQVPFGLKACGMIEVGCRTMATILKTTLSYFIILRSMNSK